MSLLPLGEMTPIAAFYHYFLPCYHHFSHWYNRLRFNHRLGSSHNPRTRVRISKCKYRTHLDIFTILSILFIFLQCKFYLSYMCYTIFYRAIFNSQNEDLIIGLIKINPNKSVTLSWFLCLFFFYLRRWQTQRINARKTTAAISSTTYSVHLLASLRLPLDRIERTM